MWGHYDINSSTQSVGGPHYQVRNRFLPLNVPLPERGANPLWEHKTGGPQFLSISNKAPLESVPCDAQLPWKKIVASRGTGPATGGIGLTIHGEVYTMALKSREHQISQLAGTDYGRISRWKSPLVSKPIKNIFPAQKSRVVGGSQHFGDIGFAIDTEGNAWWMQERYVTFADNVNRVQRQYAESIALPPGETAKFIHYGNNVFTFSPPPGQQRVYVLTTDSNRTYVRAEHRPAWIRLTDGCVGVSQLTYANNSTAYWLATNRPTATVDPPPGGGVTAVVEPIWIDSGQTINGVTRIYSSLTGFRITNPGHAYTSPPNVTMSRAPDLGGNPTIKLAVFSDHVVSEVISDAASCEFVTNAGAVCRRISFDDNTSSIVFESRFLQNRSRQNIPFSDRNTHIAQQTANLDAGDCFIGTDKRLYRYNSASGGGLFAGFEVIDDGPWACLTYSARTFAGVKEDGGLYTWGRNSSQNTSSPSSGYDGVLFGDESAVGAARGPTQIATEAEWVSVFGFPQVFLDSGVVVGFIAIRKDAICRSIDQPMEYWPDWHYETQT